MEESSPFVKNILLLDSEGKRIAVKYYDDEWASLSQQLAFEKSVFQKTQRANARGEAEIILFDDTIVVYKFINDLHFFVTGSVDENELILNSVLTGFFDSIAMLLSVVERKTVLENLDLVLLALDEITDSGVILETEPQVIASRVTMRGADADVPLAEQTFSQALALAKEQLARSLLK